MGLFKKERLTVYRACTCGSKDFAHNCPTNMVFCKNCGKVYCIGESVANPIARLVRE